MLKINEITGWHVNYFLYCKRHLWLSLNGIHQEKDNSNLAKGRFIEKKYYSRVSKKDKQVKIGNVVIDRIDRKNKIISEIKTSSKHLEQAKFQLLLYLYIVNFKSKKQYKGRILIPKERKSFEVILDKNNKIELLKILREIRNISKLATAPKFEYKRKCLSCSHKNFCLS